MTTPENPAPADNPERPAVDPVTGNPPPEPTPVEDPDPDNVERALGTGALGDIEEPEAKPTEEDKAKNEGTAGEGVRYGSPVATEARTAPDVSVSEAGVTSEAPAPAQAGTVSTQSTPAPSGRRRATTDPAVAEGTPSG